MKKQIILITFLLATAGFNAASAQGKSGNAKDKNQKKEQPAGEKKIHPESKGKDQASGNNEQPGKSGNQNKGGNNSKGNNKRGNANGNGNIIEKKNDHAAKGQNDANGYKWDRDNFKERKTIRNHEKVTVCHKFNDKNEPGVTIQVSSNAVKAHLAHGDVIGACPSVSASRYSNIFLDKRNAYFNHLETTREQVVYSQSILDYAISRLSDSRQQLVIMQTTNVPVVEIQRKQVVVTELEQNVSLLQSLIGVAANLLVNKLQN